MFPAYSTSGRGSVRVGKEQWAMLVWRRYHANGKLCPAYAQRPPRSAFMASLGEQKRTLRSCGCPSSAESYYQADDLAAAPEIDGATPQPATSSS